MLLLLKWSVIQLIQLLPEVFVELLKREIPAFFQIMEEPFLENADRVFHGRFETGFSDLEGKDHRVVVLGPFSIVLMQLRLDQSLFAITACLQLSHTTMAGTPPKAFSALLLTSIHCISFVDSIPSA